MEIVMIKKTISPIIIFLILVGACFEVSRAVAAPLLFIDFPSILIVLVIAALYSYSRVQNHLEEFANGAVYAGWLVLLIGLIGLSIQFTKTDLDFKFLMEANSVLWLGVFYGYSIKLILRTIKN